MTDDNNELDTQSLARVSTFGRFHNVARRHLSQMGEIIALIPPEPSHPRYDEGPERDAWDLWDHEAWGLREQADEHATIATIFACAACELYINDAAARLLGDTYFLKHMC